MNESDKELVERARRAIEPFKSFPRSIVRGAIEAIIERLERPEEFASSSPDESRHDLRLIASMNEGWLPISTAPKDKSKILVANAEDQSIVKWLGYEHSPWQLVDTGSNADDGDIYFEPTHWMPLPTAPGKEEPDQS